MQYKLESSAPTEERLEAKTPTSPITVKRQGFFSEEAGIKGVWASSPEPVLEIEEKLEPGKIKEFKFNGTFIKFTKVEDEKAVQSFHRYLIIKDPVTLNFNVVKWWNNTGINYKKANSLSLETKINIIYQIASASENVFARSIIAQWDYYKGDSIIPLLDYVRAMVKGEIRDQDSYRFDAREHPSNFLSAP